MGGGRGEGDRHCDCDFKTSPLYIYIHIATPTYLQRVRKVRGDPPVLLHIGGQQLLPPLEPVGNLCVCGVVVGSGYNLFWELFVFVLGRMDHASVSQRTSKPQSRTPPLHTSAKSALGAASHPCKTPSHLGKNSPSSRERKCRGERRSAQAKAHSRGCRSYYCCCFVDG